METIIIGGDARFACLARLLRGEGKPVGTLYREGVPGVPALGESALATAGDVVANCPPRTNRDLSIEDLARGLPEGARLWLCGPSHPAEGGDGGIVDLWADEKLLRDNAALTAEGAVCAAMGAGSCAIRGMRCLIVGWGRVGRALAELLAGMGARVTVASRSAAKRNRAIERGAEAVPTELLAGALRGQKLVFNTAPGHVLDGNALIRADRDAMLIDLASAPYGIDLAAAWRLGLRAWREPALPGRHCPQSAAEALLVAMRRNGYEGGGSR